jgi:hypothetical protein
VGPGGEAPRLRAVAPGAADPAAAADLAAAAGDPAAGADLAAPVRVLDPVAPS